MAIRAVVDTGSLVPSWLRINLQQAAEIGAYTAIWSPWIIAELNRVLVWRWIKDRTGNDLSASNEHRCSQSAKAMMAVLLPTVETVSPLPPYPPAWEHLTDIWDYPVWATAVEGKAQFVISENTHDYPPRQANGRYTHEDIEYLSARAFLDRLAADTLR